MASRTCWNCKKDAHQTPVSQPRIASNKWWYLAYVCDACGVLNIGRAWFPNIPANEYSRTAQLMNSDDAEVKWLPEHAVGREFDDVPEWIGEAATEAYSCYSFDAYRAAILLARSVVEAVAKDNGVVKGNLAAKIDGLAEKQLIRPLIKDTAHEIRHLGNDMAHGDFIEPVSAEDADDVLDFMSVVLAEVYQLPAQVNARKSTREARRTAAEARRAEAAATE